MSQTGTLEIDGLGNQAFSYDINTTLFDTITSNSYAQTGFAGFSFGFEFFTAWCTDTNPGQIGSFFCPPYRGPAPFGYNSSTGRFNAIGPVDLNGFVYVYATFGDAQLFETSSAVPTLSDPMIAVLMLALLAIAVTYIPREAGVV
jgi:hypothetical protein